MSKITVNDIKALGFPAPEMFRSTGLNYDEFLQAVIDEQALLLEGRLGSTVYSSAVSPTKDYVKRAEFCLTAAELLQRRINFILGNVVGAGQDLDVSSEEKQRAAYLFEAQGADGSGGLISKITSGITSEGADFESGVLTTDHFTVAT